MRWLRGLFGFFVALLVLFEEWGWEPLRAAMARLGRLPPIAWIERGVARLPPYAALALLAVPGLTIIPVKVVAVWLIARGHAIAGLLTVVVAKLAGTAVLARLFELTQPALMRIGWFARLYARWLAWKNAVVARVRASAAWRSAARWLRVLRQGA